MSVRRILLAMTLLAGAAFGQDKSSEPAAKPPGRFYHLEFTVKELDGGKVVNSRSYTMAVITDRRGAGSVRAVEKIRVHPTTTTMELYDVGTNLDCLQAREAEDGLMLELTSDISYLVPTAKETDPIIRQNRWSGYVLVPLKKSAVVFTSADPASKGTLEMDVIATPVN